MRSLLSLPLISALSALVLTATMASTRAQEPAGTPVTAQPLVVERVIATFAAHGTLQDLPRKLYFKESGTLLSFDAEEGQRIEAGQRLGRLDDSVISATVDQRRVELRQSETDLGRSEKLRRQGVVSQTNLDDARNARDLNRAQLAEAIIHKKHHVLTSPAAGVITRRYFDHPQWVTPETPVFALRADDDPWLIDLNVPESDISGLSVGDEALVRFPSLPDLRLPATVRSVAGIAEASDGFFKVRLELSGTDPRLRAGIRASARLPRPDGARRGTVVPVNALHNLGDGKAIVYLARDLPGTAERLAVKVALISGERAVLDGVPDGYRWVLTDGVYRVRSGDRVIQAATE